MCDFSNGAGGKVGETFRFVNEDTVFTLPWEVAIKEGLFARAGHQVEVPEKNPGNTALGLFERNKEVLFECGQVDAFNVCEWAPSSDPRCPTGLAAR
jgi:hypothetical protein